MIHWPHLLIELAICIPICALVCGLLDWWRHRRKR